MLHFQIGVVGVSLRCSIRRVRREFEKLYGSYRLPGAPEGAIDLEVRRRWRFPFPKPRYELRLYGLERSTLGRVREVLPHLEWAVNRALVTGHPGYYQIHASVLQCGESGFVFAGPPGSGKSTLAAGLLARGWKYLSDEFALIDPDTRLLHPYPKALCVKAGARPVCRRLGLPLPRAATHVKGAKGPVTFLNPLDVRRDGVGSLCSIRCIVLPTFEDAGRPALEPISRAECAFLLNGLSLNFHLFRERGIDLLADIVREADCFRLRSGDIEATCDLIDELRGKPA